MTDNRTTELLRKLLDERGVEWWPMHDDEAGYRDDRDTEFLVYGCKHVAHEWGCRLQVDMLTPEQVIAATLGEEKAGRKSQPVGGPRPCGQPSDDIVHDAATLGGGKLTAEQVRELMEEHSCDYPSPTDPYVYITEYDWQAIADELNELGSEREKKLEKLAWDMWREITTCPDYRMPPCMTESICERVRNLEIGMDERR